MDSLASTLVKALKYSAQFNFPLTKTEIWYWQIGSTLTKFQVSKALKNKPHLNGNYYIDINDVTIRNLRLQSSLVKWVIAREWAHALSKIPFIESIFVTGALAMDNSPEDDDIDFMIITKNNTLWLTRFIVILLLGKSRRPVNLPEHSSLRVSGKICDNLYLDSKNLLINTQNLYTAHEILQARCVFDRSDSHYRFLSANNWTNKFLPIATKISLSRLEAHTQKPVAETGILFGVVNYFAYIVQLLYMYSKISNEKISLHQAFFHPNKRG